MLNALSHYHKYRTLTFIIVLFLFVFMIVHSNITHSGTISLQLGEESIGVAGPGGTTTFIQYYL